MAVNQLICRFSRACLLRFVSEFFGLLVKAGPARQVLLLAAVCLPAIPSPVSSDELRAVVDRTLSTSPEVGIVVEGRRAAAFEVDQASGLFLPTVDLRTTGGEQYSNDQTSRNNAALSGKSRTVGLPRYEAGITLR